MGGESLVGEIPSGWRYTTLGEACEAGGGSVQTGPFGSQLHASDYVESGIPSIMPQNIGDNRVAETGIARISRDDAVRLQKYRVSTGDIVYSRRGDVEKRALIRLREDGWLCGTGCLRVRFGSGVVVPEFASFYLGDTRVRDWIVRHAHGATMPNLNTGILSGLPFVVPPVPEQRAIAGVLGALDDKIDLNRRMSETLEAMARALFKSWFVDFDPVRAKAEGRDPGLPGHVGGLFPAAFDGSEMGRVPRGWTVGSILTQASLLSGGTPRTDRDEYWNGEVRWASAKDVSQCGDSFLLETERTITEAGLSESATQLIPAYATVVVARGATTGRMVLFGREMAMNQTCYALVSTEGTPFALHCLLRKSMDILVHASHGSVFDTITTSTFSASRVLLAPVKLCEAFEALVSPIFLKIRRNSLESRTLAALRDTLLPKLISGELRIPDAERIVGEVA